MAIYTIPLISTPQTLSISLVGVTYNLAVRWNWVAAAWVLDISDVSEDPIVQGIPLVTGVDLLAQYAYLGIGGQLVAQTTNDAGAIPTFENLGAESQLYFVTTP